MNETNATGFRERNIYSHSERKKKKLVASSSESRVNPIAELLKKKIHHLVDEAPPMNTYVFQGTDIDPCDVLNSQPVLKTMQHSLQLDLSSFK